jgi:hypothetical protein
MYARALHRSLSSPAGGCGGVQITLPGNKKGAQAIAETSLVEVGPRMCLNPIRIFAGSFRGQVRSTRNARVFSSRLGSQGRFRSLEDRMPYGEALGFLILTSPTKVWSVILQVLYDNPTFVSPNAIRSEEKKAAGAKYSDKIKRKARRTTHLEKFQLKAGELDNAFEGNDSD